MWSSGYNIRPLIGMCEFESQQECIFLAISVADSVRTCEYEKFNHWLTRCSKGAEPASR